MPSNIIQSFAERSGKSVEEVEHMWNSLKRELTSRGVGGDALFAQITGIMKKNLKIQERNMELHEKYLISEKMAKNIKGKQINWKDSDGETWVGRVKNQSGDMLTVVIDDAMRGDWKSMKGTDFKKIKVSLNDVTNVSDR